MPIYIDQKFKRCDCCGKMIPPGTDTPRLSEQGRKLTFCSDWCVKYYKANYLKG